MTHIASFTSSLSIPRAMLDLFLLPASKLIHLISYRSSLFAVHVKLG
jgi:hypothetical protein